MDSVYYRFTVNAISPTEDKPNDEAWVAMSQMEFYRGNDPNALLDVIKISNIDGDSPPNEEADKLLDGDPNTKWLDSLCAPLVFELSEPIGSYRWMASCDCPERDPSWWILEEKRPNNGWEKIDERNFEGQEHLNRCTWTDQIIIDRTHVNTDQDQEQHEKQYQEQHQEQKQEVQQQTQKEEHQEHHQQKHVNQQQNQKANHQQRPQQQQQKQEQEQKKDMQHQQKLQQMKPSESLKQKKKKSRPIR